MFLLLWSNKGLSGKWAISCPILLCHEHNPSIEKVDPLHECNNAAQWDDKQNTGASRARELSPQAQQEDLYWHNGDYSIVYTYTHAVYLFSSEIYLIFKQLSEFQPSEFLRYSHNHVLTATFGHYVKMLWYGWMRIENHQSIIDWLLL